MEEFGDAGTVLRGLKRGTNNYDLLNWKRKWLFLLTSNCSFDVQSEDKTDHLDLGASLSSRHVRMMEGVGKWEVESSQLQDPRNIKVTYFLHM